MVNWASCSQQKAPWAEFVPFVRLPRRDGTLSDREGKSPLDPTLEASPERVRYHIRRPSQRGPSLTTQPSYTVRLTRPQEPEYSVISQRHRRHRAIEFKKFLIKIDKNVPAELDVHIAGTAEGLVDSKIAWFLGGDRAGRMAVMPKITYTDEFKRDAVALVDSGVSQKQVARDLGVAKTTLQAWVRDARFQSHGMTPTTDPEQRKDMSQALRRIRELEMENEVLRRAAAYLSQAHITPPK